MPELTRLLNTLEAHYGLQIPKWPPNFILFLLWWRCCYPASAAKCAKGW